MKAFATTKDTKEHEGTYTRSSRFHSCTFVSLVVVRFS
jgi:hypothetical protein